MSGKCPHLEFYYRKKLNAKENKLVHTNGLFSPSASQPEVPVRSCLPYFRLEAI